MRGTEREGGIEFEGRTGAGPNTGTGAEGAGDALREGMEKEGEVAGLVLGESK